MPPGPTVLSLGSVNADFQMRIDRRPDVSETLIGTGFCRLGGGKGANAAFIARRLGCAARLFGRVGADDLAEQALEPLRAAGVDLGGVSAVAGGTTGVSVITVPPDGKKGIVLAPNANRDWDDAACAALTRAIGAAPDGAVLILDCEVPVALAEAAAEAAGARGLRRILDPSPADAVSDALLCAVDIVLPNPGEARTLTGCTVADAAGACRAAEELSRKGPATVCAKLPDGGCVLWQGGRAQHVAGPQVDPVDTTGAGDAFAGALAAALAQGRDMAEAVRWAVAAADIAVTAFGSQPAYPDRAALDRRLALVRCTELGPGGGAAPGAGPR